MRYKGNDNYNVMKHGKGGGGIGTVGLGQIIYFNPAQRGADNFKFYYMFIWNSS